MVFADGMVLQQLSAVRLWGWCESFDKGVPGRQVTVTTSWDGRTYTTVSDSDGRFEGTVQTPCAGGPYEVTYSLIGCQTVVIPDIVLSLAETYQQNVVLNQYMDWVVQF